MIHAIVFQNEHSISDDRHIGSEWRPHTKRWSIDGTLRAGELNTNLTVSFDSRQTKVTTGNFKTFPEIEKSQTSANTDI